MGTDTAIVWKWKNKEYRHEYKPEHVHTMYEQVQRHNGPERFICITDDPRGLSSEIETVEMPPRYDVENPTFPKGPNCFHRLWAFSDEFKEIVGDRFMHIDLDTIITHDLSWLLDTDEEFIAWGGKMRDKRANGSLWVHQTGTRSYIYDHFQEVGPHEAIKLIREANCKGSDQGWIQYCLGEFDGDVRLLDENDGVYSYRINIRHQRKCEEPDDHKLIIFHGPPTPWDVYHSPESPWLS